MASTKEKRLAQKYNILKHRYGLSKDEVNKLNEVTDCFICQLKFDVKLLDEKEPKWTIPHVDHNHETGKVRGVLCAKCNFFLGIIENKIESGELSRIFEWINQTS